MSTYNLFLLFTIVNVARTYSKLVGSQPILQRTIEAIFTERSEVIHPGCKWIHSSPRQSKMCRNDPGLVKVISTAKEQVITACEETFMYDRWNCSRFFNSKPKNGIFKHIYRETALIYALTAASLTHAVAKACSAGNLLRCSCFGSAKGSNWQWKRAGCGDDFRYGKRATRNFLDYKHAGSDQIAEALKQDVQVGMDAIGEQLREVCKCHGFSGSCTTKTCWKRLGPFNSVMGLLKKHYHHAVKKNLVNYTSKRALGSKARKRLKMNRKDLVYLQKTPNLCIGTGRRICKDHNNCSTLCCGRGYSTSTRPVESHCRCRMVKCCFVKCDTCQEDVDYHVCK